MDLMFKPLSKVAMEVLDTNKDGQLAFGTKIDLFLNAFINIS